MDDVSEVTGTDLSLAYAAFREATIQTALHVTSLLKVKFANFMLKLLSCIDN